MIKHCNYLYYNVLNFMWFSGTRVGMTLENYAHDPTLIHFNTIALLGNVQVH
jgi:hypothetical protein